MTSTSSQTNFISELKGCSNPLYQKLQYWTFIKTGEKNSTELSNLLLHPSEYGMEGAWIGDPTKKSNYSILTSTQQNEIDTQIIKMIEKKYQNMNYNKDESIHSFLENTEGNPFDNKVIIIDEAHKFISGLVNKLLRKDTSNSGKIYHHLLEATNVRIILLTCTPIINSPVEIAVLFNILRGYIKTWTFHINPSTKLNKNSILDIFDKEKCNTYDYISYHNNNLTITRNPYGFINKQQKINKRKGGTRRSNSTHLKSKKRKTLKKIICGKPQTLQSQFHISYDIIINIIKNNEHNTEQSIVTFIEKSLLYQEIQSSINIMESDIDILKKDMKIIQDSLSYSKTPISIIIDYIKITDEICKSQNKKRKVLERNKNDVLDNYKSILCNVETYKKYLSLQKNIDKKIIELNDIKKSILHHVQTLSTILVNNHFIEKNNLSHYKLTKKGKISSQISEIHPLIISDCFDELNTLNTIEIIQFFSCFTTIRVHPDYLVNEVKIKNNDTNNTNKLKNIINKIITLYQFYDKNETDSIVYTGINYENPIIYDLIEDIELWCLAKDEISCKLIIQNNLSQKSISIGDFSKAIIKISALSKEIINICEKEGFIELHNKLSTIDKLLLKYVCTTQSLYV